MITTGPRRRVAYVAGRDPELERDGGHSAYVRAHARAAVSAGWEPHIFGVGPDTREYRVPYGVIHRVRSVAPFRQKMIAIHYRPLARALASFLAAHPETRFLHAFGVWGFAAEHLGRGSQAPPTFVTSSYTTFVDESDSKRRGASGYGIATRASTAVEAFWASRVIDRFERKAYLGSRFVLYNYESVARRIAARHGPEVRLRRIGYAAEAAFLPDAAADAAGAEREPGPPKIVTIARHDPRKGLDVLLHALARLRKKGIPFHALLLGTGPLLDADRRLSERLGLTDVVEIPGFVEDVLAPLSRADVFCLPSREEQSGSLAVLEALQAGVAIVASSCDGIPEDLSHDRDALLAVPGDPDSLADALERVLTDSSLRKRLAGSARENYLAHFSASAFGDELAALYDELATTA